MAEVVVSMTDGELLRRKCGSCGGVAERVFSPVRHKVRFRAGFDGGLGRYFGNQRERDTYLDREGLILREPRV